MTPRRAAAVVAAWLALAGSGCGPSPARLHCLDSCEQANNTCIAQASTGPALQECSDWASGCVAQCPP